VLELVLLLVVLVELLLPMNWVVLMKEKLRLLMQFMRLLKKKEMRFLIMMI
jgi:hypothetical protein